MIALLANPLVVRVLLAVGVAAACGAGYYFIRDAGYNACERDQQAINGAAYQAAIEQVAEAQANNDKLVMELAKTREKLNATKTEYLAYANGISGNCPADLGLLNNAAASGQALPTTSGIPANPSAAIAAAALAANIAENYGRANACIAQLNALVDWHASVEKGVK